MGAPRSRPEPGALAHALSRAARYTDGMSRKFILCIEFDRGEPVEIDIRNVTSMTRAGEATTVCCGERSVSFDIDDEGHASIVMAVSMSARRSRALAH